MMLETKPDFPAAEAEKLDNSWEVKYISLAISLAKHLKHLFVFPFEFGKKILIKSGSDLECFYRLRLIPLQETPLLKY